MSNPIKIYHRHILRPYMWYKYTFFVNSVPSRCSSSRPTNGTTYEYVFYIVTKEYHDTLNGIPYGTVVDHKLYYTTHILRADIDSVYTFYMNKPICHVSGVMRRITYRNGQIYSTAADQYVSYYCNEYDINNNIDLDEFHLFTPGTYELSNTPPPFRFRIYNDTQFDYVINLLNQSRSYSTPDYEWCNAWITDDSSYYDCTEVFSGSPGLYNNTIYIQGNIRVSTTNGRSGSEPYIGDQWYWSGYLYIQYSGIYYSSSNQYTYTKRESQYFSGTLTSSSQTFDYPYSYTYTENQTDFYITSVSVNLYYNTTTNTTTTDVLSLLNAQNYNTVIAANSYIDFDDALPLVGISKNYGLTIRGTFTIPSGDSGNNYTWKWGKTLREYTLTTKTFSQLNNKSLSIEDGEWHFKAN